MQCDLRKSPPRHASCGVPSAVSVHASCLPPSESYICVLQAQVRVIAQTDNVAGVRIPKFEQNNISGESKMNLTGLGKGGQQVQQCRKVGLVVVALSLQPHGLVL